jgi:hypothetical protein
VPGLNDQDHLRRDWAWQTAAERDEPLASSPTLCRWENRADRPAAWRVQELLVEPFIGLFAQAPAEWVLDFDSTDDRVLALAQPWLAQAQTQHESSRPKQRVFGAVRYAAQSWDRSRRVLVKAEPTDQGSHPRFVVPNLEGEAQALYDPGYCARGELENRIKEQPLGLFSDRTRCHDWWANPFRLLLSSCAYVLLETVRRLGLAGTELARAQAGTIRLKLLKIGAVVLRNTRRVRLLLSSSYPYQHIFAQVAQAFHTG